MRIPKGLFIFICSVVGTIIVAISVISMLFIKTYYLNKETESNNIAVSNSLLSIELENKEYEFTGHEINPKYIVKYEDVILDEKDYNAVVTNNINIGNAQIKIECKGKYSGSAVKSFSIVPGSAYIKTDFTSEAQSVKIKWGKSKGAELYYIYRYSQAEDDWAKIGESENSKSLTYNENNLESASEYKYIVRGVKIVDGSEFIGVASNPITVTTCPEKIKKLKYINGENSFDILKWEKDINCDGYEVYARTGKAEFERIGEVTYNSFNISNEQSAESIEFKLRGYCIFNNIKFFGEFSDTVKKTGESYSYNNEKSNKFKEKKKIIDVSCIMQNSSGLPTGCEVTALTMLLNYYGFDVSALSMAKNYLPKSPVVEDNNGTRHGPDYITTFAGDPQQQYNCYGCYAPCIKTAANNYFSSVGSNFKARDISGTDFDTLLEQYISNDSPVLIWVTSDNLKEPFAGDTWINDETGETVQWTVGEHCVVLTGFDKSKNRIYVSDPLASNTYYNYNRIKKIYNVMGKYSVCIDKK